MEKHLYVSFHSMVNCGVPCTESSVHSVSFYNNKSYFWDLTIRDVEYPSIWFRDYLTLEELFQFMNTENGFENFEWRGKTYNTDELRKKYKIKKN